MTERTPESFERLFAATDALRDLLDLFTDRDLDDSLLDEITVAARDLAAKVEEAPQWDRQAVLIAGLANTETEEGRRTGFPYRAIGGGANPCATPMTYEFGDDVVTTEVTLRPVHGGAPGRGHGGILAGIFDELSGAAPHLIGTIAATARLTVNYRAPIPIGEPLKLRVWVHEHQGRKVFVRGDARRGDDLIADVEALFIDIDYHAIDTSGAARH